MRLPEFYGFMKEREQIRLNREAGKPWPWTDDPILQEYKFTNVKRAHDRTTRWFWSVLDEHKDDPPAHLLFNCAVFRYFGTIEFSKRIGWIGGWDENQKNIIKNTAKDMLSKKQKVFTGAYVITNQGIKAPKQEVVVDIFLDGLWQRLNELICEARVTDRWECVAKKMMEIQGFGGTGFMTKEILQDAMHTKVLNDCIDRNNWCPVGPGARRGLNRLSDRRLKFNVGQNVGLDEMLHIFGERDGYWPGNWVELELHDIQFQLCEFDKYERVRLGQGRPRSKYRRPM